MQHCWMDHCRQNVTHHKAVAILLDKECCGQRQTALNMFFPRVEGLPSHSHTGNNIKNGASSQSPTVTMLLNEYGITKSNGMCQGILGRMEGQMKTSLTYMAKFSSLNNDKTRDYKLGVSEGELILISSDCNDMGCHHGRCRKRSFDYFIRTCAACFAYTTDSSRIGKL